LRETDPSKKKRFTKLAADPDKCAKITKKYGWDYQRFIPNNAPVLKVDCEFV